MTDKPLSITLEMFKDGLVLGVAVPGIDKFPQYVQQVQAWIDEGLLVCHGEPKPDPVMDHLFYVPKPAKPVVNSFPYKNGQEQRRSDHATGLTTECPSTGVTRLKWLAGYHGEVEKEEHEYRKQWADDQAPAVRKRSDEGDAATSPPSTAASVDRSSSEVTTAATTVASGEGRPSSSTAVVQDPAALTMGLEEVPAFAREEDHDGPLFTLEEDEIDRVSIDAEHIDELVKSLDWPSDVPPSVRSVGELKDLCVPRAIMNIEDVEFWQILAIYAAIGVRGMTAGGYAVTTWESAIHCLELIEEQEQTVTDLINEEFSFLFSEGDDMATALKAKAKIKSVSREAAKTAKGKAGKPASTDKAKGKTAKVDDSKYAVSDVIEVWDVSKITKSPYDERIDESDKSPELLQLVSSLKQRGQLNPLLIRPTGEHIAGWRRVRAAKLAGIKTLQVRLVQCNDLTARLLVFEENERRKPLTEREQCNAYNSMLKAYIEAGKNQKQLAADLSLDHSTLSNKLRLKSLSHDAWVLFEEGWLSIDHLRSLATHAIVPKFEAAFLEYVETQQKNGSKPLPEYAVKNAMSAGYQAAYRRVDSIGQKITDAVRKELGVTTIDDPQLGKIEVTTNVEKFDELKTAAAEKAKKKEEKSETQQAAKPTPKVKAPEKGSKAVAEINAEIVLSWCMAFATAIHERFAKPKAKDTPQLVRLAMLVQQSVSRTDKLSLGDLLADEKTFVETMNRTVLEFFDVDREVSSHESNWSEFRLSELEQIAKWLAVNGRPHFKPTTALITKLTDEEAIALRDECALEEGVTDTDRNELNRRLMAVWEPPCNWFPPRFDFRMLPAAVPF